MYKRFFKIPATLAMTAGIAGLLAYTTNHPSFKSAETEKKNPEAKDLILPAGFSASILASDLGATRHIAVTKNGDIFVKLSKLKDGKGVYLLRDTDKDGVIDDQKLFGNYPGSGVTINKGYLYSSSNSGVYRYKLNDKEEVIDFENPEEIVYGLIDTGRDNAKPVVIDEAGNLYVAVGTDNDPCRIAGTGKGMTPCTILDSAAGVWKFKADQLNQTYSAGTRYATGLKNIVGFDWNASTKTLFAMMHGRGKFHDFYPQYYTPKQSAELPAETMYELRQGDDAGWPYTYYDQFQKKKILAPEYGGDGKKTGAPKAINPTVAFPAHLAPNGLLFYTGKMFPARYRNGAFVAFHGQSPELKKGYLVAFVPFANGKPSGKWEIFADNFAGTDLVKPTGPIQHRPCGLAQGPDGALYVTDDLNGTIFKIEYKK